VSRKTATHDDVGERRQRFAGSFSCDFLWLGLDFSGFLEVKWLHLTGEVDKCVRCSDISAMARLISAKCGTAMVQNGSLKRIAGLSVRHLGGLFRNVQLATM